MTNRSLEDLQRMALDALEARVVELEAAARAVIDDAEHGGCTGTCVTSFKPLRDLLDGPMASVGTIRESHGVAAPWQEPERLTQSGASTAGVQNAVGESVHSEGQHGVDPSPTAKSGEGVRDQRPNEVRTPHSFGPEGYGPCSKCGVSAAKYHYEQMPCRDRRPTVRVLAARSRPPTRGAP